MSQHSDRDAVIALERAALDRWSRGDPGGYTEIAADDVTYFDHLTQSRVDGIAALQEHAKQFEGKVNVPKWEMVNPHVLLDGGLAVLTFNWHTFTEAGELTSRWNATEVYRRNGREWEIVHLHWAMTGTAG